MWDLHHEAPMIEALTPLNEYLETLERIVNELKRTGAKIIFASTTSVAEDAIGRSNTEIALYNKETIKLMHQLGVEINDLHKVIQADLSANLSEDKLHLNNRGSQLCAAAVVDKIKKYL
ncbi:hypothetical protein [Peribacillus deserti]|uniref:hypothetical protein n=1 Tax=Peribacillus deserti TaxID=673318 RepID=UPI00215276E0|nr:hypothetical protein [Peribacillus deserti]